MVVSGPNAGGKTVALKSLGLAALMVRAGLPDPGASEGSRVAVFDVVLTDVGDDQSLKSNLSTFSAHVKNLAEILDEARPGALVRLDELAGGTDPREGEALAAAVLDSLCARGGTIACTTHYEGLKALALGDARFVNASVGFDLAAMSPTFKVTMGVPGPSSALAVARRFGVPLTVIQRAEGFLSREAVSFDEMVEKLRDERRALELARHDAEREAEALRERRSASSIGELERLAREGEGVARHAARARRSSRASSARGKSSARRRRASARGKPTEADVRAAVAAPSTPSRAKVAIGGELEPRAGRTTPRARPRCWPRRARRRPARLRAASPRRGGDRRDSRRRSAPRRRGVAQARPRRRRRDPRDRERIHGAARGASAASSIDARRDRLSTRPPTPICRYRRATTRSTSADCAPTRRSRWRSSSSIGASVAAANGSRSSSMGTVPAPSGRSSAKPSARAPTSSDRVRASRARVARTRPGAAHREGGDGVTVAWLKW